MSMKSACSTVASPNERKRPTVKVMRAYDNRFDPSGREIVEFSVT